MSNNESGLPRPDGCKLVSPQGARAIKGGIRPNSASSTPDAGRKPPWLRVRLPTGASYQGVRPMVTTHPLNALCAESKCPNFAECQDRGTSTLTKTSLLLGLGESGAEIDRTLDDLRGAHVDVVTLGQHMRPSPHHLPVQRFVVPEQFLHYRELALGNGFLEAVAGPQLRSSYRAGRVLEQNNLGL